MNNFSIKCIYCGGGVIEHSQYVENNKYFGMISIDIAYEKCDCCGAVFIPYLLNKALNEEYQRRINEFLLKKHNPSQYRNEYYDCGEVSTILGLKMDSIKYGHLIYRIMHNGELLFWKKSVDQFAKTRDGRTIESNISK